MLSPSDPLYPLRQLVERISGLEFRLQQAVVGLMGVRIARGKITVFTGGSTTCTVLLSDNVTSVTKAFLTSYSPVVNDQVLLVFSPIWSGVLGKVSV